MIFKAEVVRQAGKDPKDNPRFVITNLKQNPPWIYEQVYCERLLKLGARVVVSVRRVGIHLPVSFPFLSSFRKIALAFGALSG